MIPAAVIAAGDGGQLFVVHGESWFPAGVTISIAVARLSSHQHFVMLKRAKPSRCGQAGVTNLKFRPTNFPPDGLTPPSSVMVIPGRCQVFSVQMTESVHSIKLLLAS